ncbi:MAG: transcriptional repressor [Deltaproteobacteria bacterium]|nr:transcriptional repressor [Deltaproteobacteria bacterium]MCB9785941.1 transcriptional repressor [Deltaproteobacteria bacterium]
MPETRDDWEERLKEYLSANDLRLTRQRHLIAEAFFETDGHPNIDELYLRVRRRAPHIGQATVYRTLRLLVDSGLAASSRFGGAATRYEASDEDSHHDHMICTECGSITEFNNEAIERLQEEVARKHGFAMHSHKMELYGLCRKCSEREPGSPEPPKEAR